MGSYGKEIICWSDNMLKERYESVILFISGVLICELLTLQAIIQAFLISALKNNIEVIKTVT